MPSKVILPKFGQTVETSEITQWHKREGEAVRKGEVLCEIATDKSSLEVESPAEGTLLKILLPVQRAAPVGSVIALLGAQGESISAELLAECEASLAAAPATAPPVAAAPAPAPATAPSAAAPAPAPTPAPVAAAATTPSGRLAASPRARRAAETRGVPLAILAGGGTGEGGRIVERDVLAYVAQVGPVTPTARQAALSQGVDLRPVRDGTAGRIRLADVARGANDALPLVVAPLVARTEAASPMRRAIAAAMSASARDIPAFALEATVEADLLVERRAALKRSGAAVGFGDYIARAVGVAIHAHPVFAAAWKDGAIAYGDAAHIAFAVALDGGLVTPVVRDCGRRTLAEIASESARLVERARAGKLKPDDYSGGVFALSNLGGFPIDRFTAIVPPGQSGILAIGRIRDEVAVRGGGIFVAKRLSLTLSADHRYIDGATGARFLAEVKTLLEDPERLER
jgi:pyruvate dehydrogenase E2 component (dihydrolipoamide acetyltransferase)